MSLSRQAAQLQRWAPSEAEFGDGDDMPVQMNLWKIADGHPAEIEATQLDFEQRLEEWIAKDLSLLGLEVLIIGRQVPTEYGGRIDLLGIDRQGNLVIIELKRHRTPREVVAQVLDYATWVKRLTYNEIDALASANIGSSITVAFASHFDQSIPDTLNSDHSMLIVASELDDASERIVQYLANEHQVNINAVFFSFFRADGQEFLGRAWLMDPEDVQERESRKQVPWSGYWFVNVGEGPHRNWDDNHRYGYIGAGQGSKYSRALQRLDVGDRLFAYMKGIGYVGYGQVTQKTVPIAEFIVAEEDRPLLELPLEAPRAGENSDDPDISEWAVGVKWLKAFPRERAKTFKGIFANQNIVCKLRHRATLDFLRAEFGIE